MGWFRRRASAGEPQAAPPPPPAAYDPVQVVLGYHQRTKHHPLQFARSLGYLDWDNQPDPFRRFDGAPQLSLGAPAPTAARYAQLFEPGALPAAPLGRATLSAFLYHSLALSAWKQTADTRWSLRVNPSSGNLHPTEGWLWLPPRSDWSGAAALWHYAPRDHALERRAICGEDEALCLVQALPAEGFLVALSSVPWRESWKYGERAYRYCQHDVGHALAALRLAAALLGWQLRVVSGLADAVLARWLGLEREDGGHPGEEEVPDLLAVVWPASVPWGGADALALEPLLLAQAASAEFAGRAAPLSAEHQEWELIDVVERAARREDSLPGAPAGEVRSAARAAPPPSLRPPAAPLAAAVIRGRRSALSLDRRTGLSRAQFESLLARLVPELCPVPFDALGHGPRVHLLLFVHRVEGLEPGLYLLLRGPQGEELLRPRLRAEFRFERLEDTPAELPLFLLAPGGVQPLATRLCCGQEIAGDGALAVAMLGDLEGALEQWGPCAYRWLHWEAGAIGQVLYLEAEALGLRGTGIGCFFDDPTHSAAGLRDGRVQTLYHFTLGGPVDDPRLASEPAYPDLTPVPS
jgi:SagB-type dehydrogenase family enzyme